MSRVDKLSFVAALPAPKTSTEKANLYPMSAEEVQLLRSFLQREMDVLRSDTQTAREESNAAHNEVKEQLNAVRKDISNLAKRVNEVESHEETQEHADKARKESRDGVRRVILATNAIIGTIIVVVVYLVDKL